jgi:hypothetical protein
VWAEAMLGRSSIALLVGTVLLGLASCDSPVGSASIDDGAVLMAKVGGDAMVPIHGWQSMAMAPDAVPVDCGYGVYLPSRFLATGTVSHMGKTHSVIEGSACWVLGPESVGILGVARHTAANGDELHAAWVGGITGSVLDLDVTFAGGTGRFAGAAGSGKLLGTINPMTGDGEYQLSGTIRYNASDGPAHRQHPFTADAVGHIVDLKCADAQCMTTSTFDGRCSVPSTWVIRFTAEGESEPLGTITDGWGEHCSLVEWAAPGVPAGATYGDGRFEYTLASGERVWGVYEKGASQAENWQDEFTFTGGTGKYRNLRGGGVDRGTFVGLDQPMPYRMEGWIRY